MMTIVGQWVVEDAYSDHDDRRHCCRCSDADADEDIGATEDHDGDNDPMILGMVVPVLNAMATTTTKVRWLCMMTTTHHHANLRSRNHVTVSFPFVPR